MFSNLLLWVAAIRNEEDKENLRLRRWRCNLRLRNALEVAADRRDFAKVYRLSPALFEDLCCEIVPLLPPRRRSDSISHTTMILTALAFYASGSYQRGVGMSVDSCIAQPTVSKAIRLVTSALNDQNIINKYIRFPQDMQEREQIKQGFYEKFKMPGVIGCIDCTHVALIRPRVHEERYFNRKYYHSRNMQMVCDSNLRIINVDGSFGGASHDSFIFHKSEVKKHIEDLQQRGENNWLLGDAGYPLRAYVMTPIAGAADGTPEGRFNKMQKTTRCTIERTFGVLKGRWRCLLAARELHYDPRTVAKITIGCCVLHNICIAQPDLLVPRLSARDRRIERYLQQRPNVVVVARRTAAMELQAGREVQARLVQALSLV